jgi:hypothetical protein
MAPLRWYHSCLSLLELKHPEPTLPPRPSFRTSESVSVIHPYARFLQYVFGFLLHRKTSLIMSQNVSGNYIAPSQFLPNSPQIKASSSRGSRSSSTQSLGTSSAANNNNDDDQQAIFLTVFQALSIY